MDIMKALQDFEYYNSITGSSLQEWHAWATDMLDFMNARKDFKNQKTAAPKMLSLKDAAEQSGLTYELLRKLCMRKEVVHIKSGSKYYVNYDKLIEYMNGKEVRAS